MSYRAYPDYSLRYDREGREREKNNISPLLTAEDFNIDEVDKSIGPQFQTMREAVRISRRHHYDIDIITAYGMFSIDIYQKTSRRHDLTPLIPLLASAIWVNMESFNFGRITEISAFYLFDPKESVTEK